MGCKGTPSARGASLIYSDGTTTALFVPVGRAVPLADVTEVAVRTEVSGATSSYLKWQPAVRYANTLEGLAAASASTMGSESTGNGVAYVAFTALPGSPLRFAEFGYAVRNDASSSQVEKGAVNARFDLRMT